MRRGFWFVAGAGAGVYVVVKARRVAEAFTPEGLRDRVAGLGVGAQLFAEEVRLGMTERESELRERFGYALDGPLQLEALESPEVSRRSQSELLPGSSPVEINHRLAAAPPRIEPSRDQPPSNLEGTH